MYEIKRALNLHGIEYIGLLSIRSCKVINSSLFERSVSFAKNVIVFLIPYRVETPKNHNISLYAAPRDYHGYTKELFSEICSKLEEKFPGNKFTGMSDHSPIDEILAAASAGLGVIGKNRCLINEKYGSYVFIGEIYTDADIEASEPIEPKHCISCGKCKRACPCGFGVDCLSAITQKKGELTETEEKLIFQNSTVWGCDICQEVCPMNKGKAFTEIEYFKTDLVYNINTESLYAMNDDDFKKRAFSWRGRKVLERNIKILYSE